MDLPSLAVVLQAALNPNPEERKAAEQSLNQLGECLKTIVHADYPEQWPDLLDWVKHNLQDQQIYSALFVLRILYEDVCWTEELAGTANVIVNVFETSNALSGEVGYYTKPEARSLTVEGVLKMKNLLSYGDHWDASFAYGWNQTSDLSAGMFLPRFKNLSTPLTARIFLASQDWLKYSSYKDHSLGLSLGLLSTKYHDLAYNLSWRTLLDPPQMSESIRRQLGHNLLSSLKYTFKIDRINFHLRPTKGYVVMSTKFWSDYRNFGDGDSAYGDCRNAVV